MALSAREMRRFEALFQQQANEEMMQSWSRDATRQARSTPASLAMKAAARATSTGASIGSEQATTPHNQKRNAPVQRKKSRKRRRAPKKKTSADADAQAAAEPEDAREKEDASELGYTLTVFCQRDYVRYLNWKRAKMRLAFSSAQRSAQKSKRKSFNSIVSEHDDEGIPAYLLASNSPTSKS